ncbi:unnamed protein product [Cunninghamella echinulata]
MSKCIVDTLLLLCFQFSIVHGQFDTVRSRVNPGCSLIQSTIYCFGGNTQYINADKDPHFGVPINDHIALDLNQFGNDFSNLNKNDIKWKNLSNTVGTTPLQAIGSPTTAPILSDNSYVVYGGYSNEAKVPLTKPFLHYDPKTDIWKDLPIPNGNNYTTEAPLINLGNDTLYTWGGYLNGTKTTTSTWTNSFGYSSLRWVGQSFIRGIARVGHTTTLCNGTIYYIGGMTFVADQYYPTPFSAITIFNTVRLYWGGTAANGTIPSIRVDHTTIATSDQKSLIIYGGRSLGRIEGAQALDYYHVYDVNSSIFTAAPSFDKTKTRFGHFAALYNKKYLLLAFGSVDGTTPANSLTVMDISNPYLPVWLSDESSNGTNSNNNNGTTSNEERDRPILNLEKLIPAVIVSVVIVICGALGVFFFVRHKRRQQKNTFVLEQQDPRKRLDLPNDNQLNDATLFGENEKEKGKLHGSEGELHGSINKPYGNGVEESHESVNKPHGNEGESHGSINKPHRNEEESHGSINKPYGNEEESYSLFNKPHGHEPTPAASYPSFNKLHENELSHVQFNKPHGNG